MMEASMMSPGKAIAALLCAACGISLAGCAPMEAPDADAGDALLEQLDTSRACFRQREVRGFARAPGESGGRERIFLDTGVRERFVLETVGACPDLDFSLRIALDTRGIGNVCTGDLEMLVIPSAIAQELGRCPVRVLGRIPEDDS